MPLHSDVQKLKLSIEEQKEQIAVLRANAPFAPPHASLRLAELEQNLKLSELVLVALVGDQSPPEQ